MLWVWINTYYIIPFLGDEHPFTSYFDVHQGYKVLTHPHIPMFAMQLKLETGQMVKAPNLF